MMDIVDYIKDLAATLNTGDNYRGTCPKCKGGSTKESSFSVRKISDVSYYYKCWRNKCGFRGGWNEDFTDYVKKSTKIIKKPKLSPFPKYLSMTELSSTQKASMLSKYHMTPNIITFHRMKYCPERDWLVIPLFGFYPPSEDKHAIISKALKEHEIPKTYYWRERDYPKIHVPLGLPDATDAERTVYIVEDPLSAIRVCSAGLPAVSICGTHFSEDHAKLLIPRYRTLKFALDPDTWDADEPVPVKANKKWGAYIRVKGLFINRDPKDMTSEEIIRNFK
jgi:hypothetical protein